MQEILKEEQLKYPAKKKGTKEKKCTKINARKYCFSPQKCEISPSKLSQPELQRTAVLCSAETLWGKYSDLDAPMGKDISSLSE